MLNAYNDQTSSGVASVPLAALYVVSATSETSLGSVSW